MHGQNNIKNHCINFISYTFIVSEVKVYLSSWCVGKDVEKSDRDYFKDFFVISLEKRRKCIKVLPGFESGTLEYK